MTDASTQLRHNLDRLSPKDRVFAASLLSRRAPSPKMQYWIGELAKRATAPADAPAQQGAAVPGLDAVVAMMSKAGAKLKAPKVLFAADGRQYRLSVAGAQSSAPGAINVSTTERSYEDRTWFGRISADGVFTPSRKSPPAEAEQVGHALKCLAADPQAAAKAYGQRFGRCCFCSIELTDGRSVSVGYGPVCAENYGLDWG